MTIDAIQTFFLVLLAIMMIYIAWQLIKKISLEEAFLETIENAIAKAKEEIKRNSWNEFDKYVMAIRNEYDTIYGELNKQREKIEELTKLLNLQTEAIKKHYAEQNKEIERLRRELHKTQNMLSRCKKKLQRVKNGNDNEIT